MKTAAGIAIMMVLIVVGIGIYLSPNDLGHCDIRPTDIGECKKVDAVVAISGGDTSARTREAIKLYEQNWAETLIFSGAAQDKTGPSNAEAMRRQAMQAGVPDTAIIVEEMSETTKQNAEQTQELLESRGIKAVILVTSAYHQRRASLEFNQRMGGTIQILNHPVSSDNQWSGVWWMTPIGWWLAIGELFKISAFYIGGSR